jgi:hypothetical protein
MDVTKLRSELRRVALALDTAENEAVDIHVKITSLSRELDKIERAMRPEHFKLTAAVRVVHTRA